jgi:hypothetical protein
MCEGFFKFPRTPHLEWELSRPPRGDKVLGRAEAVAFLDGDVIVEEKVDGANLGFSLDAHGAIRVQNRGSWIERSAHPQFQSLWGWIAARECILGQILSPDRILFGEWCFAVHSVHYDQLPDWFLGFDLYDCSEGRFWSTEKRDHLLKEAAISQVPHVFSGRISVAGLREMLRSERSRLGSQPLEGLYVRREGVEWLQGRAKLVRPDFLGAIQEHWSSRTLVRNKLRAEKERVF